LPVGRLDPPFPEGKWNPASAGERRANSASGHDVLARSEDDRSLQP
jgi:hypothetical protein